MKFFTDEKYQANTAASEYESHFLSIVGDLPLDLKRIQKDMILDEFLVADAISLHDSRFQSKAFKGNDLFLTFGAELDAGYKIFQACYRNAIIIRDLKDFFFFDNEEEPESDIMCHEVFKLEARFSHSLLFASGDVFEVSFDNFELTEVQ